MSRPVALSVVLGLVFPSPMVRAQAPAAAAPSERPAAAPDAATLEKARGYFDAGRQAYDRGQFAAAIAAFEEALRLTPRPSVIFSAAQAWRRQYVIDRDPRTLRRAVELYRQYIGEVSDGGRRSDAVQHLGDLEPLLLRVEAAPAAAAPASLAPDPTQLMVTSQAPHARARLDDGPESEMPLIATVAPGKHRIRITAPGHFPLETEGVAVESRLVVVPVALRESPARLGVKAPAGTLVHLDGLPVAETPLPGPLELPAGVHHVALGHNGYELDARTLTLPAGALVPFEASFRPTMQRKTAWGVFVGSGALLAGAATFGGLAIARENEADDLLTRRDENGENLTTRDVERYREARSDRDQWRSWSIGLGAAAATLLVVGAGLYFFDTPGYTAPRPVDAQPPPPPGAPATAPGEEF